MAQQNGSKLVVPQAALDAIRKAGGIERCPEALLKELSLGRVFDEPTQSWELADRDSLLAMQARAQQVFGRRQGYLQAADLDLVEAVLKDPPKRKASLEDLNAIEARAARFEETGIPPIFEPAFYPVCTKTARRDLADKIFVNSE